WQEGNGNAGSGGSTGNFHIDAPTVAVTISSNALNNVHTSAIVTFTFSEAPVSFSLADTSVTGGTLSGLKAVDATHATAIFTADVGIHISNASVNVTPLSWQDGTGGPGTGGSTGSFSIDTPAVAVAIDRSDVNLANNTA